MLADRSVILELLSRNHLFRGIEELRILQALDILEEVHFPAGKVIFQQNDDPDFFYLVLDGRVRVSRFDKQEHQFRQIGYLVKYDYFGQEVLETNWPRQVTVLTDGEVTLLRLSVQNFIHLIEIIPELSQRLQMVLDSYKLMLRSRFMWHDPEEMIHFIARRHVVFMVRNILGPLIFGAVTLPPALFFMFSSHLHLISISLLVTLILITLAWLVLAYIDWTNDYYIVTSRRVVYIEKLLLIYDNRAETPLEAVQSTSSSTTQTGRIFQYGNVAIRTLIGTILFRDVPNPEQVMALIQEHQMRTQIQEVYTRQSDIRQRIDKRMREGPPLPSFPKPGQQIQQKPSAMHQFLATMFHTRYEVGGTAIFRTHWFILIQRIWMPTILLIGLFSLVGYSFLSKFALLPIEATCGLSGLGFVFVFIWWLYQYVDWHNDVYLITPEQVVDVYKKPLGSESRQAAPLNNILSVESKRLGLMGYLLNFGTLYIRVGDQTLTFDDVYRPSDVQRELYDRLAKKRNQERQDSIKKSQDQLADWVAGYNQWNSEHQQPEPPPTPTHPGF